MISRFFKTPAAFAGTLIGACMLCACAAVTGPQPQVVRLTDVPPGKIVVVGRFELRPPLQEGEQISATGGEDVRNAFFLYCGDRLRDLNAEKPETLSGSFSTEWDRDFFIKVGRSRSLFISGGFFFTASDQPGGADIHTMQQSFQVELRPDDEAVYIGTIQLFRSGADTVQSVTIRDDYQWADTQFKERFGTGRTLRKALVKPAANHE